MRKAHLTLFTAVVDRPLPYGRIIRDAAGQIVDIIKRSLDFSAEQVGRTGICKGLRADWNDCLNLGGGESAMVSFMHHWALRAFVEAAQHLGRNDDVKKYGTLAEKVRRNSLDTRSAPEL